MSAPVSAPAASSALTVPTGVLRNEDGGAASSTSSPPSWRGRLGAAYSAYRARTAPLRKAVAYTYAASFAVLVLLAVVGRDRRDRSAADPAPAELEALSPDEARAVRSVLEKVPARRRADRAPPTQPLDAASLSALTEQARARVRGCEATVQGVPGARGVVVVDVDVVTVDGVAELVDVRVDAGATTVRARVVRACVVASLRHAPFAVQGRDGVGRTRLSLPVGVDGATARPTR
jgi:hypothetical protein